MTIAQYTNDEGYTLRVFSTMYMDWGVELIGPNHKTRKIETLHYSPSGLSTECYGFHWEDEDDNPLEEGKSWTKEEWLECLKAEMDDFIEAFKPGDTRK